MQRLCLARVARANKRIIRIIVNFKTEQHLVAFVLSQVKNIHNTVC